MNDAGPSLAIRHEDDDGDGDSHDGVDEDAYEGAGGVGGLGSRWAGRGTPRSGRRSPRGDPVPVGRGGSSSRQVAGSGSGRFRVASTGRTYDEVRPAVNNKYEYFVEVF